MSRHVAGLDTCTVPAQALVEGDAGLIEVMEVWQPDMLHIHAGSAVEGHGAAAAPPCLMIRILPLVLAKTAGWRSQSRPLALAPDCRRNARSQ
jgi:hypothetical protein